MTLSSRLFTWKSLFAENSNKKKWTPSSSCILSRPRAHSSPLTTSSSTRKNAAVLFKFYTLFSSPPSFQGSELREKKEENLFFKFQDTANQRWVHAGISRSTSSRTKITPQNYVLNFFRIARFSGGPGILFDFSRRHFKLLFAFFSWNISISGWTKITNHWDFS